MGRAQHPLGGQPHPRQDGIEFLALAPRIPVRTSVTVFPLEEANARSAQLRRGRCRAAVLAMGPRLAAAAAGWATSCPRPLTTGARPFPEPQMPDSAPRPSRPAARAGGWILPALFWTGLIVLGTVAASWWLNSPRGSKAFEVIDGDVLELRLGRPL